MKKLEYNKLHTVSRLTARWEPAALKESLTPNIFLIGFRNDGVDTYRSEYRKHNCAQSEDFPTHRSKQNETGIPYALLAGNE